MFRVAWRGVVSRRLRLALTALSIALGVGFVAGTFILTDTLGYAFNSLFSKTGSKIDAVVQSQSGFGSDALTTSQRQPVPEALVDTIKYMPEVQSVAGFIQGYAQIIRPDGKAATALGGAPTLGLSTSPPELDSSTLRTGRHPVTSDEVSVDQHTADVNGFKLGQRIHILFETRSDDFTLVGTFGYGDVDSMAGATVALFDPKTAQREMNRVGVYDAILMHAAPGVSQAQLRDGVAGAVGPHFEVITGQQNADRTSEAVSSMLSFFSTALMLFGAIALFVGAFIIFNTFNILVAQRTRELGLVRALGAGTGQVVMTVLLEALILGVIASAMGLLLGVGIAVALTRLLEAMGMEMPPAPLQFLPRTALVAIGVGVGSTLLAALAPALRTRRLSPVTALHLGLAGEGVGSALRRAVLGVVVTAGGLGLLLYGLFGSPDSRLTWIAPGALGLFVGVAMLAPLVARPLAGAIGWPIMRLFHLPGRLGRDNAVRNPARTARTASALMIGVALVSFVTIFADSFKSSTAEALDRTFKGDVLVTPPTGMTGFPAEVAERLSVLPQFASVVELRITEARNAAGGTIMVLGADPAELPKAFDITTLQGDIDKISAGGVAVGSQLTRTQGIGVGSDVVVRFNETGEQRLPVVAVFDDNSGAIGTEYVVSLTTYDANVVSRMDSLVAATLRPGVSSGGGVDAAKAALTRYPNLTVQDRAAYRASTLDSIDQMLNLMYVLLALAIVIAVVGIVNTLALSVMERRREIGLLRAVGMTQDEVRAMIRWEAVIVALLGAVLGIAVGLGFGWLTVRAMQGNGLNSMTVPGIPLAVILVLAALAGVLAAILPAHRAAQVDVLRAIAAVE